MIILDMNQVMLSNLMMTLGKHINSTKIEEDLLRHFILNSIRSYNSKFRNEFGELVIACDAGYSWRKNIFPYYKANRKKNRDESKLDWNAIFTCLNKIRDEIKENFPYRVIHIHSAEADDIIATLCHEFANTNEKILIMSGDRDFKQLQSYMNVKQRDPVQKKWIVENQPELYLKEHIMRGDSSDGVPNFLSDDDCLVVGKRQKMIQTKKIQEWIHMDPSEFCDERMLRGFKRNEQLIDLNYTPEELQKSIIKEFESQCGKDKRKLFNYFIQHNLKNLMESVGDF